MSYQFNTTAIRTGRELSDEELYRLAPSIFAQDKHESRSDRFKVIPTIEVLNGLRNEGFIPVAAQQQRVSDPGRAPYTKHVIRLRHRGDEGRRLAVGDTFFEVVLRNGNDGSSAYNLFAGLLRLACLNGMVVNDRTIDKVSVRHSGDVTSKVIEGTFRVLGQAERALAAPQDWAGIQLDQNQQLLLAEHARQIRLGDAEGVVNSPIRAGAFLNARRFEDRGNDLWSVWNRVQENTLRGGLTAYNNATNRRTTTRAVRGIDQDLKLNRELWQLGEDFAAFLQQRAA